MVRPFVRSFRAAAPCGLALALIAGCGDTPPTGGPNPGVASTATASRPALPGTTATEASPDRPEPFPNQSLSDIATDVGESPATRAVDRAADRADRAVDQADAAIDTAVRRTDATVNRAMDRADAAIDKGLGRAEKALDRADGTVRRVGGALKSIGEALERPEPSRR